MEKEGYKRLDLSSLNFSNSVLSYDDATKDAEPFLFSDEDFNSKGFLKVKTAEKDYKNKCVKLEI